MEAYGVETDESGGNRVMQAFSQLDKQQSSTTADGTRQQTNQVSVELMLNSRVSPEQLVQYCNRRFSLYTSTRIKIEEEVSNVLTVCASKPIDFVLKGISHSVQRYFLCGHCFAFEQRERKILRRHVESCLQRTILPNAFRLPSSTSASAVTSTSRDRSETDTTIRREDAEASVSRDDDETPPESYAETSLLTALSISLRTDSKVSVKRTEQYATQRFSSYFESGALVGGSLTVREDASCEALLHVRTNFDFEFVRQVLGTDTTRHLFVCGLCFSYETMKKTHLERHLEKGSCPRQRAASCSSSSEDNDNGPRCYVERCVVPQAKGLPHAHAKSSSSASQQSGNTGNVHWQATDRVQDATNSAPVTVTGGNVEPVDAGLQAVRMHNDAEALILQVGSTPIIVLGPGSGSHPIYIQSPHAPIVIQTGNSASTLTSLLGTQNGASGCSCTQIMKPSASSGNSAKRLKVTSAAENN